MDDELKPASVLPPETMEVKSVVRRVIETAIPTNRELDSGSVTWTGVVAPALGALGYALEHVREFELVLRSVGVPDGAVTGVLFGVGLLYAALTRKKAR